jgi:sugar lactone lactonase YvrE
MGPQTYDPQGDGCPAVIAYFTGGVFQTVSDGLANIYVGDPNEELERELTNGNIFPSTAVGTAAPVTQAIQVHFNSNNPPAIGSTTIPDAAATGVTTTAFSIAPGISDFTINTTTPEFPMGSLVGGSAYANTTTTANFLMWTGLPTCTQLGAYPKPTGITDYDCLVYVTFNPTAPGVRQSQLKVTTANGSVYNFALYGVGTGGQLAIDGGAAASLPVTGLGTTAGIAVSQSGTVYIADPSNNRIVVEPVGGGAQTNLAFTGVTPATLNGPMGVAVDTANNVYISDTGNNRILEVNATTGIATTLGNYVWVPGNAATAPPQYAFSKPQGLAVDKWNNVYVADTGNSAVVEITSNIALGGAVPLLNYPGAPKFSNPVGVAVDSQGNIYVADTKNPTSQIVVLPPGGGDLSTIPTSQFPGLVGSGLRSPGAVAVDAAGNVYVSDVSNNNVIEVPASSGPGSTPFALNFPSISTPGGLALDASGNLYVADTGNKQILVDNRQNPLVNFGIVPQNLAAAAQPICANTVFADGLNVGTTGAGCPLTVTNIGTSPVTLTSPLTAASGTGNAAYALSNTCTSPLPSGLSCTILPTFTPTVDNGQTETVNVNGGTQSLALTANGAQPEANVVLSASYSTGTTPSSGATATITATVTQPHIMGNIPSGNVVFTYTINASNKNINGCGSGGTQTVALNGAGTASFQLPTLATGVQYTVSANYTGDTLNSATPATPLIVQVPGTPVTATVTSTAAQLTFTYGGAPPAITGTVTPTPASPVTFSFGSSALATTPIGTYPVTVSFSGAGACAYGFPPSVFSSGGPALVTEKPAALTYTIPNFTAQYGAQNISYGATAVITGAVNGDGFGATFTPAKSSLLNVGTYPVVPTVIGANAGNYTITAPSSTLTVTQAPVAISITAAKTSVLNTTAGLASATYQISVGTTVLRGIGVPSGSVTVTDNFTPIVATGYGTPATPTTTVVPLVAGVGSYVPTNTTPGIHQYSYAYSGDSNFQTASVVPSPTAPACVPSAIATNCLIVDNPDFTLTSNTGPIVVIPGVVPSGNGLLSAPNQSTAAPETAVLFVNAILGFTGSVNLSCQTQNPSYVSCFMTPTTVCFATTSSSACTNTATAAATVVAIQTPATLPLGFFNTGQNRTELSKTVLAFLPFGVLAFCMRRRRRLSKALWMLIAFAAIGAGMSGCGGNQVNFYTPVPTGPQTVTVTATYLGNGTNQPAATRSFVVPIAID